MKLAHSPTPLDGTPALFAFGDSGVADGISFTEHTCPVIHTHPNKANSWYGQSTSYARVVKDGGLFIATFQGNGFGRNVQVGGVTTVAGLAMSEDGIRWRVVELIGINT